MRSYIERMEFAFIANEITTAVRKRAILLSSCGEETYKLLRNLVAPDNLTDKTFDQLKTILNDHFNPKQAACARRFTFNSCIQTPGQRIADFVAELKSIAKDCEFGAELENNLRDRLSVGVRDPHTKNRLMELSQGDDYTYAKAVSTAQALEAASKNSQECSGEVRASGSQVYQVKHSKGKQQQQFRPTSHQPKSENSECYRCLGHHKQQDCRHKNDICNFCKKMGHIYRACRQKDQQKKNGQEQRKGQRQVYHIDEDDESEEDATGSVYSLYQVKSTADKRAPFTVNLLLNGEKMTMEIDTGASSTLISEKTYEVLWKNNQVLRPQLQTVSDTLSTYTGESIPVRGKAEVVVAYEGQRYKLPLLVVPGKGPSLLGRNWLTSIPLDWHKIHEVHVLKSPEIGTLLKKYTDVFEDKLGTIKDVEADIHVDPEATPRYLKARPVPYALREKVTDELQKLEDAGIIERVKYSEWAAPIVPVLKRDGRQVRICGDFSTTINSVSQTDKYPIPRVEDLYARLAGGKTFTKIDMSNAYLQVVVSPTSRKYLTINTHRGLFQYTRLPFGVSSAPGIFQRIMDGLLKDITGVCCYLDDILVTGSSEVEHMKTLDIVLHRLRSAGVSLKKEKCAFHAHSVEYLGHKIDEKGLHPLPDRVKAIVEAPTPRNLHELKSYVGLLNYYGKFLPHLSTVLKPLHHLTKKDVKFAWTIDQATAFKKSKDLLKSSNVLVHFDQTKELILACDASPYGVGAVLSQIMEDKMEHPVAFASRTLSSAEGNYSQLDKEALSIIFGVKHFHQYLYGRKFTIVTDHKPLLSLFSEKKAIPQMASPRVQRWALTIAAYDYIIQFRPGEKNGNADAMSRLPLKNPPMMVPIPGDVVLVMNHLFSKAAVSSSNIKAWTQRDPTLSKVYELTQNGWTENTAIPDNLKPYATRRYELSTDAGCVLWGNRLIIPPQGQKQVLQELHETHPGINKMKALARSFVWWPHLDADIEAVVKECHACQDVRKPTPEAPLHPWEWPPTPWDRLHIDYAGPFLGKWFLVLIDAHSKWIDAAVMSTTTSSATIEQLLQIFATHGLPRSIVTDNGSCFTSQEFQTFTKSNGIKHICSSPYHPASNGLAERAVQTLKNALKKTQDGSLETRLYRFLARYRITPQSTTGQSPSEMLFKRKIRSRLDVMRPDVASKVLHEQTRQKINHDKHVRIKDLHVGDTVFAQNFGRGKFWLPGEIIEKTGPLSVQIQLKDGRVIRRHLDHVRLRESDEPDTITASVVTPAPVTWPEPVEKPQLIPPTLTSETTGVTSSEPPLVQEEVPPTPSHSPEKTLRRSIRLRKPPDRLDQ